MTDAQRHTIVVGIDGSVASKSALAWAVAEARLRGDEVVALQAWQFPGLAFSGYGATVMPVLTPDDLEKIAAETLHQTVADVIGADLTVAVEEVVRQGHPASVLIDAAKEADLLVVGSEGHGAFAGMLLGSTSMHIVHHATCPVTVVRPEWTATAP